MIIKAFQLLLLSGLLQASLAAFVSSPRAFSTYTTRQEDAETFTNPVVYEDFADNDVSLGPDGAYYFSASNMHYSPGAPILRSHDLANWELIGHSVPSLDFGDNYNMTNGTRAYRGGTWASTMRYRASNKLWYWIGCVNFWHTYIYTAETVTGPWTRAAVLPGGTCYYDCGLLIDDDDTMYVVYGATNVSIAQLSPDGLSQERTEQVFTASDVDENGIEGNRLYKRKGLYYILNDHPGDRTYIWKSTSPWGPYEPKVFVDNIQSPVPGGGAPHQGSLVQTTSPATGDEQWYFMSFTWAYPAGRMPVLAPITWDSLDEYPTLTPDPSTDGWGATYPLPLPPNPPSTNWTGIDTFPGPTLSPAWEWNHNPDETKYSIAEGGGLTLSTASVITNDDLYAARNTLTHRIHGEYPVGTVSLDISNMADGDRCGLAAFRDRSAYIGITRDGDVYTISVVHNVTQDETTWETTGTGHVVASEELVFQGEVKEVWLRALLDARASGTKEARFAYSVDGGGEEGFRELGGEESYVMWTNWAYFMGYRFGVFNYASRELGGEVMVREFRSE
ncbi:hypothetical protein AJ79_09104 [Helicocarpus griseus UAMH5409]|uniref:Beta-xylosidase C-terminal Concanavalin A-like domain-containing protein n=1 Tax=Helicocarpus griseus UAMH5409 TaxID=1447875 RepID=A0A2B7WMA7_9EURO|nr:hypothetical protein AJ79_09104 [Helicocarpus griseus UAMH5409]